MTGSVDFFAASKRHHADATLLQKEGREPNAGHLFGFSAECGLKALLVNSGYPTDPDGDLIKPSPSTFNPRTHIDALTGLLPQIITYLSGRSGAKYLAHIPNVGDFADWKVSHRYYAASSIPSSVEKWGVAADEIQVMLQNLQSDKGVV